MSVVSSATWERQGRLKLQQLPSSARRYDAKRWWLGGREEVLRSTVREYCRSHGGSDRPPFPLCLPPARALHIVNEQIKSWHRSGSAAVRHRMDTVLTTHVLLYFRSYMQRQRHSTSPAGTRGLPTTSRTTDSLGIPCWIPRHRVEVEGVAVP